MRLIGQHVPRYNRRYDNKRMGIAMRLRYNIYTRCPVLVVLFALFILSITACNMRQAPMDVQLRNIELEPFTPPCSRLHLRAGVYG